MSNEKVSRNHTVLVIDDDPVSLAIIALLLGTEGHEAWKVESGEDALQMLSDLAEDGRPSVVLADLQMPGLCGNELASALRIAAPQALLLAMSATEADTRAYDGFVKKPVEIEDLRAAVDARATPWPPPMKRYDREPALDEAVCKKLQRLMTQKALNEVYETCLSDARTRIESMRAAAAADDFDTLRREAHAIKGGAGMVGARKLAKAATGLELGVYQKDDIPQLLDDLVEHCDELHRILLVKSRS